MYRLGLDIGITSVGWAVLNTNNEGEPNRIVDMGVRIFDIAEADKGKSLSLPRREARGARRRNRRHRHRIERIKSLLENEKVIAKEKLNQLYSQKGNVLKDIYEIRYEALSRKITNDELARLLVHLSQKRGFKSNRKNADNKSDEGKLLSATNENAKLMEEKGYLTVGEMLYKDEKFKQVKRNKGEDYSNTFLRSQIEDEVNIIFEKQKEFGNVLITDILIEKYKDILFSQRDFDEGPGESSPYAGNQIEKMVGKCTFEKNEERAPKASYTFEYFNLLQKINAIKIIKDGVKRELTSEERIKISEFCHKTENVDYAKIHKILGLDENEIFANLSYGRKEKSEIHKTKFQYLSAYHEMRKAFDKLSKDYIVTLSVEKRNEIAKILTFHKTDEKIHEALGVADFIEQEKDIIVNIKNFSKFGNLSVVAMQKIIPHLEKGLTYDKACVEAGYDFRVHSSEIKSKYLPKLSADTYEITSPVVKRAISQTINVINGIVKKYGSPALVNIELARDISKDIYERTKITNEQNENAKKNQKIYDELKNTFKLLKPSGQDIIKYKLWLEQDGICLYTQEPIPIENLFKVGYCEIDHIIPYSISFDDSYTNKALVKTHANREKGNRVPLEYVKSKNDFVGIVNTYIKNYKKKQNLLTPSVSDAQSTEMKARNLTDTRFATKFIANYIRDNLMFDDAFSGKTKVVSVNGQATSFMRKRWGINKSRVDGDIHHAVDAVVVACISKGTIDKVTSHYKYNETFNNTRDVSRLDEKFPLPWDRFRDELEIRTSNNPSEWLARVNLPNYKEADIEQIKPVFISRRVRRKTTGQAHKDTVRSFRDVIDDKTGNIEKKFVSKKSLQELKLDKKTGEIEGYYNPSSDILLYELLKQKLTLAGGDAKEAFPDGFVYKPTPKGGIAPKVKKVKIYEKSSLNVEIHKSQTPQSQTKQAVAANGDMVRIDLYKVEGDGYYFVPIYVSDLIKETLPNKACVQGKPYEQWKEMKDEDFLFSIYPNDLLLVEHKKEIKFSKNFKESKLPDEYVTKKEFVYYKSAGISVASISVITHNNAYKLPSLGIKTLLNIEKYNVDVLGNKYKAPKETRK